MSLHPHAPYPIPEETQRVARAAFPRGNLYMQVADHLGPLYHDAQFTALFPRRGQPAEAPARLALVTVLQCAEGLSDRQAADAVRSRIDWKYVLGLDLTDPGFDHTVLSEFRARLVTGAAEHLLLDTLLTLAQTQGLLKARGRQRTDSTHVLAAIRVLNRLERVGETLRAALNSLAVVAPAWVQALAPPAWYERYAHRVENYQMPKTDAARKALAAVIGADGQVLLQAIDAAGEQPWLQESPAVQLLRRVWAEQLSLSRLNHRLPGCEAHPEVVQGTAELHHQIADALLPQADPVFHDATALHTAVHMFDPESAVVQRLVGPVLLRRQFLAAGFLRRHEDLHMGKRKRQEA